MKKHISIFTLAVISTSLLATSHAAEPEVIATSAEPLLISPAPGSETVMRKPVTLEAKTSKNKKEKSVAFDDNLMKISAKYPTNVDKNMDLQIEKYVTDTLAAFQANVPAVNESPNWKHELHLSYRLRKLTGYTSVEFTTYEFTGGAHGETNMKTFNFDNKTGKNLSLAEIFSGKKDVLKQIAIISQKTFLKELKAKKLGSDKDWIKTGTEAKDENYTNFIITNVQKTNKNTVITVKVFFTQYQVASYADGIKTIFINSTNLK